MSEQQPVEVFRAPNGLTLLVKENHATPVVSVTACLRGGLRDEDETNHGVTHFMQRMLVNGTHRRSAEDIASDLEFLGTSMAPFTGKDVFGASMTCLARHFPAALDIFADCLLHPTMPHDECAKECQIILTDIERRRDDTLGHCLELCERAMFEGHPYRLSVAGSEHTLSSIDDRSLQEWHARFYRPDQMVVALVGDVAASHAQELLFEAFGAMERQTSSPSPARPCAAPTAVRELTEMRDKRQVAVSLGFHGPAVGDDASYAFDVLNHVLSGMGSRLFIELRDRLGLGYLVNCHFESRLDAGAFKIYIGTSEERRERAHLAMLEELARLREQPVSQEELVRTRAYMLGLFELALQRTSVQASRLAYYQVMGRGHALLEEYPRRITDVSARDVLEVARRHLDVERYAIAQVIAAGA